jgi:hypothetical protein
MDGGGDGVSVYAEAKGEYTKQLCQYIVPALQKYFLDLLEDAKSKEPDQKRLLLQFQKLLEEVPEWNKDKVLRETTAVATSAQCDYLDELLTAVFIAHTKVLSAIRLTTKQKKLNITIPKLDHFLHRTLTECARLLWSNTYLFSPFVPSIERQRNLRQFESLLYDGVLQGIRGMLPVKNILREYLNPDEEAEEEKDEEDEEEAEKGEAEATQPVAPPSTPERDSSEAEEAVPPIPLEPDVAAAAAQPALVVDTSQPPPAISFAGQDTANLPEVPPEPEEEEPLFQDADEDAAVEAIQFVDAPPEPIGDFEDLEKAEAAGEPAAEENGVLPMDFEELG